MTDVRFRPARKADLPMIIDLLADDRIGQNREIPGEPLDRRYVAAFDALAADPNQMIAVAEVDGAIVGCLQISFIPGLSRTGQWRGQIENVRIASDQRGVGLGKAMLGWAIEQCRHRGCGLVQLTADKSRHDAHRFYAQLGFDASHDGFKLTL